MKIAIVNDVMIIGEALRRLIETMPGHEVPWVARSGEQAIQFCVQNRPDLILMDLVMPGMDGVETTRRIMQHTPCAILIVTASPDENTNMVFRALGAGALDVTATPVLAGSTASDSALAGKIKIIAKLIKAGKNDARPVPTAPATPAPPLSAAIDTLVAIGASTGGPVALARIFSEWTPPPNAAVVIVQHIDQAFTDSLANWLRDQTGVPIRVIEETDTLQAGKVLIAKTNDHLVIDSQFRLTYSEAPLHYPYRPSVDVFFRGIARHWKRKAIGVLLTGMGRDGAEGLLAMRNAGKLTITQDQASSAVYGMPRAAAERDAADMILPLGSIAAILNKRCGPDWSGK